MIEYELLRQPLVELDNRLCLDGGIFYLGTDEIGRLATEKRNGLAEKIHARRLEHEEFQLLRLPQTIVGDRLEELAEMDEEILSGMLTVINNFVADSFETSGGMIKTLQHGKLNIYIERGVQMYLACVFSGHPKEDFRLKMRKVLIDIWDKYKQYLKHWNGEMGELRDVNEMLWRLMIQATQDRI